MRIALVCHTRFPIRPPFAGGLEAHNWHLAHALVRRGHDLVLFASGDSDPEFVLDPIHARHVEADFPGREHRDDAHLRDHVDRGYEAACARIASGRFDIVHNHSLHRFVLALARDGRRPTLTSLHTPPLGGLEWFLSDSLSPTHRATFVSRAQSDLWFPAGAPPGTERVPNGIDLSLWPFRARGDGHAVWSGRIVPDKGAPLAIAAARRAGLHLELIGPVEDAAHFETEIAPMLGKGIAWRGALRGAALADAVGRASVFLATPTWPEPFGLAAIEAMACGVPVAAFDMGGVREIIGETSGRYAPPGDVPALADAIRAAVRLDRDAAHRRIRDRFRIETMIDRYEALYAALAAA